MLLRWCLRVRSGCFVVLAFLCTAASQVLAPLDVTPACLPQNSSGAAPLLDTHQYLSLESLWFPDDESIDLFQFPVPQDPVRWELVDQSECRNVWQYCGDSPSDILISQFITGAQSSTSNNELVISLEFSFFSQEAGTDLCSLEASEVESINTLIVEVDDTTGQDNVHIEVISQCIGNQSSVHHDFTYTPMNHFFELVFRSNLTRETCLNISRVRVFNCEEPAQDTSFPSSVITCNRCPTGQGLDTERGECFLCPDFSISGSRDRCVCTTGHLRSIPGNYSLPCDECASGYFSSDNGSCIPCPLPGFHSIGSAVDACKCFNKTLSSGGTCQFCAANYVRNSSLSMCVLCPAGSRRDLVFSGSGDLGLELESVCTCTEGSLTLSGQNVTSYERCDSCDVSLVWNGTRCVPCPANSQRLMLDAIRCTCDSRTLTLAGQSETVTEPCFCMDDFYRPGGSMQCQRCPLDSSRALRDSEGSCPCLEGFTRKINLQSLRCFVYIGFNISSLTLMEGEGSQVTSITVLLSQISATPLAVNISITTATEDLNAHVSPYLPAVANVTTLDIALTHVGNTVALEEDASFTLSLVVSESEDFVVGGPGLFGELNVVISDDDLLYVGFTEDRLEYDGSEKRGSLRVNISTAIGRELVILIRTNDTNFQPSQRHMLVFSPNGPTSILFEFDLDQGFAGSILISLEVATYPESLNSVRERITVGGYPGLYQEVVLSTPTAAAALSRSAVIGISISVVIALGAILVVFCLMVMCYLKQGAVKKGHT